jgi:nitroreductase
MSLPIDPAQGPTAFAAGSIARTVDEAMLSRRCVRAFKPDPVSRETIEDILGLASRAPSGSNIQPWQVVVVAGAALERLTHAMYSHVTTHGPDSLEREYNYYPVTWRDPYLARRRALGWSLYGLLGIGRGETAKANAYTARNYLFFDAPTALIFTIDRDMEQGSWLDYGMFLQSVMLAARARGLDTCPQAAIANAHAIVRRELGIPADRIVVCGMAIGTARTDEPINGFVTKREPVAAFARFEGFE